MLQTINNLADHVADNVADHVVDNQQLGKQCAATKQCSTQVNYHNLATGFVLGHIAGQQLGK